MGWRVNGKARGKKTLGKNAFQLCDEPCPSINHEAVRDGFITVGLCDCLLPAGAVGTRGSGSGVGVGRVNSEIALDRRPDCK